MKLLLRISPADNVGVAMAPLGEGQVVEGLTLRQNVPFGHKIALRQIVEGELILKYGYPIGRATRGIAAGEHVHSQNVESALSGNLSDLRFETVAKKGAARS